MKVGESKGYRLFIYLLLWCLYNLQGMLYTSGGMLSRIVLVVLLLFSFYYFIMANTHYVLPPVLKVLSVLVCVFAIYGLIRIAVNERIVISEHGVLINSWDYLKSIMMSFLPIYVVYVETYRGRFSEDSLKKWSLVFLVISIALFYYNQQNALQELWMRGSSRESTTNSVSYEVLSIMILAPLFKKRPFFQYVIVGVCLYYVLIGMKRGALICGFLAILWFIYYSVITNNSLKSRLSNLVLTSFIVVGGFAVVNNLLLSNDWFNTRLEMTLTGDSSNRMDIYGSLFQHFLNENNLFTFLFGNGADATVQIGMNYAHNDWLEIAINNGLLGLVLYFIFWVALIKTSIKVKKITEYYPVLVLFCIIYIFKSFFSMSYSDITICASTALGYSLAVIQLNSKVLRIIK